MAEKERVLIYECISGGALGSIAAAPGVPAGLLAQGVAMRDALAGDLAQLDHLAVSCVAARWAPLPAALKQVRRVAPDVVDDPAGFLAQLARDYDRVWAIAPESDGLLAALAAAVGQPRWLGCTPAAIRLAASKSATRARLAAGAMAVPRAWAPGEPEPRSEGHWIVKPDDGAGAADTFRHANFAAAQADLLARLARGVPSTLEAWVDGPPLSLSLLCCAGQAELLSINRQRIVARPGKALAYRGVDIRAEPVDGAPGRQLAALAQRIAAAVPGLAGYVGVDLVWHPEHGPVVIEINPRLTCAYVGLSAALGRNLAGEILLALHPETTNHVLH
jgi:tyramine---L-glutamate ligase